MICNIQLIIILFTTFMPFKGKADKTMSCHDDWIKCLKILTRNTFISGSLDNTVKIWNSQTGECIKSFYGHLNSVTSVELILNDRFISGSKDNTIKLWNINSGECLRTFEAIF